MKGKAKWLAIPLALSMLAGLCGCSSGEGATGTVTMAETNPEFFQYEIISKTASIRITDYNGTDSVVVIPAEFEERKVTAIGEGAFEGNQVITEVVIPDTVTEIEDEAFYNSNLEKITLPKSLTQIGNTAFGKTSLTEIEIPEGTVNIKSNAFRESELINVSLPATLETIGGSAFCNNSIEEVYIPESVTSIGNVTEYMLNSRSSNFSSLNQPAFDNGITMRGKSGSFAETYANFQNYTFITE